MSTVVILATADGSLAQAWERQLPPGRSALRLGSGEGSPASLSGVATVVVLDAAYAAKLPQSLAASPTILVGEARSVPYEQARLSERARVYLTYVESTSRLREFLPLVDELALKQSMIDLLSERVARGGPADRPRQAESVSADPVGLWDLVEGAVGNLENREALIAEFLRASRRILHASHTLFFLREADAFRSDRGASSFALDDPLVSFFERNPVVVDGSGFGGAEERAGEVDMAGEVALRSRIALWGARLIVPVHDNSRLLGLIAMGVRDDGHPYDAGDRARAVHFARLFRHFLGKSEAFTKLAGLAEKAGIAAKYLPATLVLAPGEAPSRHVPLVVRELIGQARWEGRPGRIFPGPGQPLRASAGPIRETGGAWASWEEAADEAAAAVSRERAVRRGLLQEVGHTLSHELGNSLVSLALLRQMPPGLGPAPELMEAVRGDVVRLETLNRQVDLLQGIYDGQSVSADVRDVVRAVAERLSLPIETGPEPVILTIARSSVEFALRSLIETLLENRPVRGASALSIQVRATGEGGERTALVSLKGNDLELEGIAPEPAQDAVPALGRIGVFIAKEVLRLHQGNIHAGPGLNGTEILIALRSLPSAAPDHA